jgi:2'-5' RNA ligase
VTEISTDYKNAWERFQGLSTLRLVEETIEHQWTEGRTDYVAFLFAITDDAVREYIARTIDRIAGIPGVEPYPERYWHVTVKGAGFMTEKAVGADELSPAEVQRLSEWARPVVEETVAFTAEAGQVNAFPEVVLLEVLDGGVIRSLNERLLEKLSMLSRTPVDGASFLPHISIARFTSAEGLPELKERLAGLRAESVEGPKFRLSEALLVQAHLAADAPEFELLARYPLRA